MTTSELTDRKITKAITRYIDTQDENLKNDIYLYYFEKIDNIISSIKLTEYYKEDFAQDAKEYVINMIDKLFTLEIQPSLNDTYTYATYINFSLNRFIKKRLEMIEQELENISLNSVEVYSNSNLEDKVTNDVVIEEIINTINILKNTSKNKKSYERLQKRYGIGCNPRNASQIAREEGVARNSVIVSINRAIATLYATLNNKYEYAMLDKEAIELYKPYNSKNIIEFQEKLEEYPFYNDYDSISDSHQYRLK
jgi:hypothetical protein